MIRNWLNHVMIYLRFWQSSSNQPSSHIPLQLPDMTSQSLRQLRQFPKQPGPNLPLSQSETHSYAECTYSWSTERFYAISSTILNYVIWSTQVIRNPWKPQEKTKLNVVICRYNYDHRQTDRQYSNYLCVINNFIAYYLLRCGLH